MTYPYPTKAQALAILTPAVNRLLQVTAALDAAKQEIRPIDAALLSKHGIRDASGAPIVDSERLYRCDDEAAVRKFYDDRAVAIQAAGWPVTGDYCPVCILEGLVRDAERDVLNATGKIVPGFDADLAIKHYAQTWKYGVDLAVRLVQSQKGYRQPAAQESPRELVAQWMQKKPAA